MAGQPLFNSAESGAEPYYNQSDNIMKYVNGTEATLLQPREHASQNSQMNLLNAAEALANATGGRTACMFAVDLRGVGAFFYLQCTIGVMILVANFTVLYILIPKRPKCNQDIYLLNLLLAETLIYLVYYPLYLYDQYRGCWDLPYWLCLWKTLCARVFMSASAFAVCLIAYDRYLILELGIRYDEYENTSKVWIRIVVFWVVVSLLFGGLTAVDIVLGGVTLDAASRLGYCPAFYSAGPFPEVPTKLLMHCGPVVLCLLIYLFVLCRLIQRKNWAHAPSPPTQTPFILATSSDSLAKKRANFAAAPAHSTTFTSVDHHQATEVHLEHTTQNGSEFELHTDNKSKQCTSVNGIVNHLNNSREILANSVENHDINQLDHAAIGAELTQQNTKNIIQQQHFLTATPGRRCSPHPHRLYLTKQQSEQPHPLPPTVSLTDIASSVQTNGDKKKSRSSSLKRTKNHHYQNRRYWRLLLSGSSQENRNEISSPTVPQQSITVITDDADFVENNNNKTLDILTPPPRKPNSMNGSHNNVEPDSVSDFVLLHAYSHPDPSSSSAASSAINNNNHNTHQRNKKGAWRRGGSSRSLEMQQNLSSRSRLLLHSNKNAAARKRAHREAKVTSLNNNSTPPSSIRAAPSNAKQHHRRSRRAILKRASRTVLCITVAFFICWIPEAVLSVLMMSCFDHASRPLATCNLDAIWFAKQISQLLVFLNAFVNPIIYTLTMPDVKRRLIRALSRSVIFRYCCCGSNNSQNNNNNNSRWSYEAGKRGGHTPQRAPVTLNSCYRNSVNGPASPCGKNDDNAELTSGC